MKRFGLVSLALPLALLFGAGCHAAAQLAQPSGFATASDIKTPTPNAPAGLTFVSDDGKFSLTSFHVAYAKRGATRLVQNRDEGTQEVYQALKTSKYRLSDSDTLLLILDIRGSMFLTDRKCAVVAQGGAKYPAIGFTREKPGSSNDEAEVLLVSRVAGYKGTLLSPSDKDESKGQWIWVFALPPPSSRLTVNRCIGGFSHFEFDAK